MKLISATITFLVLALSASAEFTSFLGSDQSPISFEDNKVNGSNPLHYCSNPAGNILEIESVDLLPNPPQAGETLTIIGKGNFRETVERGAKVLLEVKYGLIRLIKQEADLCEEIENVDLQCPLEKGRMTFKKKIDLPKAIPPGKYSVLADVYTADGTKIACLQADDITFRIPRLLF